MKNKKNSDFLNLLSLLQKNVLNNKPSLNKMLEEIRMMKFKIRPLEGDILKLNFRNQQFIEALWNLGKVDEFLQKEYLKLNPDHKKAFSRLMEDLYHRLQAQLNSVRLKNNQSTGAFEMVEMEIFKERQLKTN